MLIRSLVTWLVLLLLASTNGAAREAFLIPRFGDVAGRAVSTIALSVLIVGLTWLVIRWIGPRSRRQAWTIGALWVALTLAFEFLAGHYLFGHPWRRLLEDYDLLGGRIWVLVLLATAVAPRAAAQARGQLPYRR